MGVSSSESHDLTAFYEMLSASFGVLSQNTGFYPSLDRIIETMLGPLNLGPGGGSYNEPISRLQQSNCSILTALSHPMKTEFRYTNATSVGCSHMPPTAAPPHNAYCVDLKTTSQETTQRTHLNTVLTVKATTQAHTRNATHAT